MSYQNGSKLQSISYDPFVEEGLHQRDIVRKELSLELSISAIKLFEKGEYRDAASLFKKAICHNSDLFEAHYWLGITWGNLGDFDLAVLYLREAVRIRPSCASAHHQLGQALAMQGKHQEAIPYLRNALELDPSSILTICSLARASASAGGTEEGIHMLESFAGVGKTDPLWHFTMAIFCHENNPQTALLHYSEALRLNPGFHEAGLNYAILLLSFGMLETGFREYEHRIPRLGLNRELDLIPRWHGEPLRGNTILVVTEQGFGDNIQFIRYARLLKDQGATVYVLCPNNLPIRPLVELAAGVDGTIIPHQPVPDLDWYVPLMSLPYIFGTTLENIPALPGYIIPDANEVARWRERLAAYNGLKVGLVWAGNRSLGANESRSISFREFSTLLEIREITFFTLQIGPDALTSEENRANMAHVIDLTSHVRNFGDTAAFVTSLDLVISVDTATAHLAGALGTPVWTLLYYPPEWRWMRDREDSPWYPSMRLFRQDSQKEWPPVLERVKRELASFCHRRKQDKGSCTL